MRVLESRLVDLVTQSAWDMSFVCVFSVMRCLWGEENTGSGT
jgi:hypothetical protein